MGLDAMIRCRCFEEGKLKPAPVPLEDLFIDSDGYLASRMLDAAHKKYDYRRFNARFAKLNDEFNDWVLDSCEHEYGELYSEWISNWYGCRQFRRVISQLGGKHTFPLLSDFLPSANGGIFPAEKASEALAEIDLLIEVVHNLSGWVLIDVATDEEILRGTNLGVVCWRCDPLGNVVMRGNEVIFSCGDKTLLRTSHFKQTFLGRPEVNGLQKVRITCLKTGASAETFISIDSIEEQEIKREYKAIFREAPFTHEGKYLVAERIQGLLNASLESGNPIVWC